MGDVSIWWEMPLRCSCTRQLTLQKIAEDPDPEKTAVDDRHGRFHPSCEGSSSIPGYRDIDRLTLESCAGQCPAQADQDEDTWICCLV